MGESGQRGEQGIPGSKVRTSETFVLEHWLDPIVSFFWLYMIKLMILSTP